VKYEGNVLEAIRQLEGKLRGEAVTIVCVLFIMILNKEC